MSMFAFKLFDKMLVWNTEPISSFEGQGKSPILGSLYPPVTFHDALTFENGVVYWIITRSDAKWPLILPFDLGCVRFLMEASGKFNDKANIPSINGLVPPEYWTLGPFRGAYHAFNLTLKELIRVAEAKDVEGERRRLLTRRAYARTVPARMRWLMDSQMKSFTTTRWSERPYLRINPVLAESREELSTLVKGDWNV